MKEWIVRYRLEDGTESSMIVSAINRVMAYEVFAELTADFTSKVIAAQADKA